ncbi:MAG: hypothetical protein V1733_07765 [bacterium]
MNSRSLIISGCCLILSACDFSSKNLPGKGAEDLWGGRIRLNRTLRSGKPVVIVPFSTTNCGYCLIDGYFTERNYILNNAQYGGEGYHMCLFNPQLDIYTFQKHFGWESAILTYPPALHEYHQDGFPTLLAFRNGKQVLKEFYNYAKFDTLKTFLWDSSVTLHPTGNLHLAARFIYENGSQAAVCVVPDTNAIPADEREKIRKWNAFSFVTFDELDTEARKKHLFIRSGPDLGPLARLFAGTDIPVHVDSTFISIGNSRFKAGTASFYGCFPNPFNKEKYVLLLVSDHHSKMFWPTNYLDYIVFTGDKPENSRRLLYGHFNKTREDTWSFSEVTSFSDVPRDTFCFRRCETPESPKIVSLATPDIQTMQEKSERTETWTLGNNSCRFPEITLDKEGSCWVAWEENGNILLGRIDRTGSIQTWYAEHMETDCYNPKLVFNGETLWLFYLSKQEGYYRLVTRSFDGNRFSDEFLVSPKQPFDVITPEVVVHPGGEITVAWCEWLANQRFLKYRKMKNGIPGKINEILAAPPVYIDGYTNAWWPSLVCLKGNEIWGAWNQHYPSTCGVYGGNLNDTASTVTQPSEAMDDREQGGYPDIFTDGLDVFVVWESDGWKVYNSNEPQKIKVARYDWEVNRWTPGKVITPENLTMLNQTPSGACDSKGNKYIVWSGRSLQANSSWGIYLAAERNGKWSDPVLISTSEENGRSPKMIVDKGDNLWISWHGGEGSRMKVKVMKKSIPLQN